MSEDTLLTFDLDTELEVRDLERREIYGRIIPFGETIMVRGRPESFAPGSAAGIDISKVKLFDHHDRAVGKMTGLEERSDGYYGTFYVSKTQRGDDMLEYAKDGVLGGLSPGFLPGERTRDGQHTRIKAMPHVGLVSSPAYSRAEVLAVREKESQMPEDTTTPATVTDPGPDPEVRAEDWSALETRMGGLEAALDRLTLAQNAGRVSAAHQVTPFNWFRAELAALDGKMELREKFEESWEQLQTRAANGDFQLETRDLDDITGTLPGASPITDLSGIVVEEFIASQLVNILDARRPFFASLGSFPAPRSGYAKIPVVTQHTLVGGREGQKEDANSRKMIVQQRTFEAQWFDGAVDIALEVIRTAEIGVLSLVWNDLLGQYAIMTERGSDANAKGVVAQVNDGGLGFTYTGTALDVTDYEGFAEDVATVAMEVRELSGVAASRLAVTKAQWPKLVAMVDANDRRILSTRGPQNADASATFTSESFELPGGITVFYVPGLTKAVLYNEESLKGSDYGPERVSAVNVEKMGQDLGILGRTMFVPRIPAAVHVFGTDPESD